MSTENKNMVKCKSCNEDIAKNAKVCLHCGAKNKKPFYKKGWFVVLALVVIISAVAGSGNKDKEENVVAEKQNVTETATQQENVVIEYTAHNVSELVEELEANALKAEEKYDDQYVELTGELAVIDSDGKYISLRSETNEFSFTYVQCYIKNEEQKSKVIEMNIGDTVVLKGKIKDVGELMGYSLDIDIIN